MGVLGESQLQLPHPHFPTLSCCQSDVTWMLTGEEVSRPGLLSPEGEGPGPLAVMPP